MKRIITYSEAETFSFGIEFSKLLKGGDVVACYGELGSGKTCFLKGVCSGLGVIEHVSSPSFILLKEYHTNNLTIYHFDLYRVNSHEELMQIGFHEYVNGDMICLIEWAEKAGYYLPLSRFDVYLRLGVEENMREIELVQLRGAEA